nr:myb-like protein G [Coffea arabica]
MLQPAISVFFPILCIIQKYYQDYQQFACMRAISVKEAASKMIHETPLKKERLDYNENFMYTMPSVNYGGAKLFPPPISCLSLFNEARHLNYYKLNMNDATFSEEEVILLGRDTMSCLRHNSHQKMWFPRRPRVEEQQHQGGDDDDDDDSSDDSSSSESDYYYTTSDEDLDDDDDGSDLENPDHDGDESIDNNNNNNNEHYGNGGDYSGNLEEEEEAINDIGDDREGNANNEGGNENSNNNNTS